jgi:uncharacterized protein involved in response to NO
MLVPLTVLFLADLAMHLASAGAALPFELGWRLALSAICFLIALIGGRIVPSFTRNWLKRIALIELPPERKELSAAAVITMLLGLLAWTFLPESRITGAILLLSAVLHLLRMAQWGGMHTRPEKLLLILHLGYGWLAVGLGLLGLALLDLGIPSSAAIHALTAGAAGTMILAVMTRATRGHTGHALTADRPTTILYLLVNGAAILRIAAALVPQIALAALTGSALLWIGAFTLFLLSYGPMLLRERRPEG